MKAQSESPLENWGTLWACRGLPLRFAQKWKGDPLCVQGWGCLDKLVTPVSGLL